MNAQTRIAHLKESILSSDHFSWEAWLKETLSCFDCTTGTIHILESGTDLLMLEAQVGVPDFLLPKMSVVPVGKGMAGIAAERKQAVQVCNLQTDESGVVRPGAKDTKVEGAITVPLLLEGKLYGTLGIAKKMPYEFTEKEVADLLSITGVMAGKVR
ncbi:GAF domain-containing protein [Lunatimonas salinarum]|uniref:GAF domain-containing protein n=1 Tax=Lunatimonas salinarum TaxID=1774590 RepID=UPI001AE06ED2|nr:GAF domain-containing protein [Lunatimonas salinarum]